MTVPVTVNPLDPNCLLQGLSRAMVGVVRTIQNPAFDADYNEYMRWIYIGQSGNLSYRQWDGTDVFYSNLPIGLYPYCSIRINSLNTTIPSNQINVGS
jgi:hypothetical protein